MEKLTPVAPKGTRITIYDNEPGTIVAIRNNRYAGLTYGIKPDNGGRVYYVWESMVIRALQEQGAK